MKRSLSMVLAGVLALGVLAGCGSKPNDAYKQAPADQPKPTTPIVGKLKIAQLPVIDSLPFWVAASKGYYKQEGVDVELITFKSANERDAALQSGAVDGQMTDIMSATSLLAAGGTKLKITSVALGATKEESPFAIVAAPGSGITKPEQLKGVEIAISNATIIDYVTDKLMKDQGFAAADIKTTSIPQINIRFEALMSGQVKAAALPEPWLSMAADPAKGGKVILNDAKDGKANYSVSVITFSEAALKEKSAAVKKFFIAYNRAVNDIRMSPDAFFDLLNTEGKVPAEAKALYKNVPPSFAQAPKKEEVESVVKWMVERKIITTPLTYEQLVDASLIPQK
ncbi:MAG: putative thiamine biosynthesis protein [Symbiobacteriaceae bacterium]|jgi:NitT/TauT family transport system substrate-binding protein|nr:putative thiamine biosynthesis protein [Symbiobacteriaceae bacterium]